MEDEYFVWKASTYEVEVEPKHITMTWNELLQSLFFFSMVTVEGI
jgi:hypothetical protein